MICGGNANSISKEYKVLDAAILLLGFLPLIFGANLLVDGASSIAKRYNVPNIVIGLTIVAFGTSSPELIVNIFASAAGNSDISLGNILGSNIFNVFAILGISAIIYPLAIKSNTTWIEIPLSLLAAMVILVLSNDSAIDNASVSLITRTDGIILLFFFAVFMSYNFQIMKSGSYEEETAVKQHSIYKSAVMFLIGLALLIAGGRLIVVFAVKIARNMGFSERIIALTIISIGTSLPELATSAAAALKKNVDIAIGNIIGSNIFNAFFILGISAVIHPVPLREFSNFDILVHIFASALLFLFVFTGKDRKIERWEGIVFLIMYILYIALLLL
jgi:cation:H+ antiporter